MVDTIELSDEHKFCLSGCRSYKQYKHMRSGFENGDCVFCNLDREINEVLWEDEHVYAWHVNQQFMRKELTHHWLIVPKKCVRFVADLTQKQILSVHRAHKAMCERFSYKGGNFHVREGDMRLNAGTVPHLHFNTFVPNGTGEVRIPVFKDPNAKSDNYSRMFVFESVYEGRITEMQYVKLRGERDESKLSWFAMDRNVKELIEQNSKHVL